jgi:hypothetical protein
MPPPFPPQDMHIRANTIKSRQTNRLFCPVRASLVDKYYTLMCILNLADCGLILGRAASARVLGGLDVEPWAAPGCKF